MSYKVFVRNWWKYENGEIVPDTRARKYILDKRVATAAEAREICKAYNDTHKPGVLSRKAEYWEN